MTLQIPEYLRVHVDDSRSTTKLPPPDDVSTFWQAYVDATGWRIDKSAQDGGKKRPKLLPVAPGSVDDVETMSQQPAISKKAAERLADAASRIAERLREFEGSLSRMEATMAVEDVRTVGSTAQNHISERLEEILKKATIAAGCEAAGLYLLDDETSQLKLRSCYGLAKSKLSEQPRPLRGALADLEALVSDMVTIENISEMTHWQSPEPHGCGMALAVRGGDLPLGTLWFWDHQPRIFSKPEKAVANLAATSIATELERESIRHAATEHKSLIQDLREAAGWQSRQLSLPMALARNWNISGWNDPQSYLSGEWYGWDVLPDGSIAVTISSVGRSGVEAGMMASLVRSAWQSHLGYRHNTGQLLCRVNDTLWQTSTGEQLSSVLYATLDPDTGEGYFSSAGSCQAFVINRYGYRALSNISHPLGTDPDQNIQPQTLRLLRGDALVLATDGVLCTGGKDSPGKLTQQELSDLVRENMAGGPEEVLTAIRRTIASGERQSNDRTIVVLIRS